MSKVIFMTQEQIPGVGFEYHHTSGAPDELELVQRCPLLGPYWDAKFVLYKDGTLATLYRTPREPETSHEEVIRSIRDIFDPDRSGHLYPESDVIGGGWIEIDPLVIRLYGESRDYGKFDRSIACQAITDWAAGIPDFAGNTIFVD